MRKTLSLALALSSLASSLLAQSYLYVATRSKSDNSIHVFSFDEQTGALTAGAGNEPVEDAWFINASPAGKHIYVSTGNASISAFSASAADGSLKRLGDEKSSGGKNPIHLSVSPNGEILVSAQYMSGDAAVFGRLPDGSLSGRLQEIAFSGRGPHSRQDASHPHAAVFSADGEFVFITDLGTDRINVFEVDYSLAEPLVPRPDLGVSVLPGSGPRHFEFNPAGTHAYLVEELTGTLSVYRYSKGTLEFVQRAVACSGPGPVRSGADIEITKDGRFLYYSNRATDDTIAIFSINPSNGEVALVGHQPSGGKTPTAIALDPSNKFLIVGNRNGKNITVFSRDIETGLLSHSGNPLDIDGIISLVIGTP